MKSGPVFRSFVSSTVFFRRSGISRPFTVRASPFLYTPNPEMSKTCQPFISQTSSDNCNCYWINWIQIPRKRIVRVPGNSITATNPRGRKSYNPWVEKALRTASLKWAINPSTSTLTPSLQSIGCGYPGFPLFPIVEYVEKATALNKVGRESRKTRRKVLLIGLLVDTGHPPWFNPSASYLPRPGISE